MAKKIVPRPVLKAGPRPVQGESFSQVLASAAEASRLGVSRMEQLFRDASEELKNEVRAASRDIGATTTHEARWEALNRWPPPAGVSRADWNLLLTYVATREQSWADLPLARNEPVRGVFIGIGNIKSWDE